MSASSSTALSAAFASKPDRMIMSSINLHSKGVG